MWEKRRKEDEKRAGSGRHLALGQPHCRVISAKGFCLVLSAPSLWGGTRTLSPKMKHLYFSIVLEDVALEHAGVQTAQMVMVPKWPIDWFTCSPRSRMGFRQVLQRSL